MIFMVIENGESFNEHSKEELLWQENYFYVRHQLVT